MSSATKGHNDAERQQRTAYMLGLLVAFSILLTALEWSSGGPGLLDGLNDDVSVDLEMLPSLERNEMIATPVKEQKKEENDRIRKVEEPETEAQPDLKELLKNIPLESDLAEAAEEIKEEEVQPMAQDMDGNELPERVIEELPEYPGGYSELVEFLTHNLRYPYEAQRNRIQGEVVVEFLIEKDGSVSSMKLTRTAAPMLNQEAERVLRMMPRWKPATNRGKPVRAMIHVPILFAI